ncbi:MAG: MarR family transcriptional regulator [Thermoleophilia bacterium]|nr:MarR family transcriptional regulator [Thermoleophilia bacterium]
MNPTDTTHIDIDSRMPPQTVAEAELEQVCQSIWKTTEEVLELLRSYSMYQIQRQKHTDALWIDEVTRAQGQTVIAVKELCQVHPEGVTLKKIAEATRVSPAAASVMVDLLVSKKMLRRARSRTDRRAILVRLTPQTVRLFEICDRSLGEAVMGVADELGPEVVQEWQRILSAAASVLRRTVVGDPSPGSTEPQASGRGEPFEEVSA